MDEIDAFVKNLRENARELRWEPDQGTLEAVGRRIRLRITPSPADTLARWFVPVAAALIVAIATSIAASVTLFGATSVDLATTLDVPRVAQEDYYRVIE